MEDSTNVLEQIENSRARLDELMQSPPPTTGSERFSRLENIALQTLELSKLLWRQTEEWSKAIEDLRRSQESLSYQIREQEQSLNEVATEMSCQDHEMQELEIGTALGEKLKDLKSEVGNSGGKTLKRRLEPMLDRARKVARKDERGRG